MGNSLTSLVKDGKVIRVMIKRGLGRNHSKNSPSSEHHKSFLRPNAHSSERLINNGLCFYRIMEEGVMKVGFVAKASGGKHYLSEERFLLVEGILMPFETIFT